MDTILDGLAHARTYPYKGKENLFTTVQQEQAQNDTTPVSEYVVFSHVDDKAFADLSRQDSDNDNDNDEDEDGDCEGCNNNYSIIPALIKDYSPLYNLLVVRMTVSESHEQLHNTLAQLINDQVRDIGLKGQLRQMGSTDVRTRSRAKRPDYSFKPRRLPGGRSDKWPTVAIEVGYSESLHKLQADASFWVTESGGDIKIVLIAKMNRSKREIVLQKWEPSSSSSQGQAAAGLTQEITISKRAVWGEEDDIGGVKSGPLVVEFEKLFLRPAGQAPEADLVISDDVLLDMAEQVWETQPFPDHKQS